MLYTALEVADHIVLKCINDDNPINNFFLQKLLFVLQRYYLTEFGGRLFSDEIEAWKFGPVVPQVYYSFGTYGGMEIRWISRCRNMNPQIKPDDAEVIDTIVEQYRALPSWEMYRATCFEGGSWDIKYNEYLSKTEPVCTTIFLHYPIIPIELIAKKG